MGHGRGLVRAAVAGLLVVIAAVVPASLAGAHTGEQSYVYLDYLSDRVEGRVEYLVEDLNRALGLEIVDDEAVAPGQLEENRAAIEAFTRDHFSLELGGEDTALTFDRFEYLELSVGSYVVYHFTTGDLGGAPPRELSVSFDGFLEGSPDGTALLLIGRDFDNGVLANEADHLRVFDAGNTRFDLALDEGSWFEGLRGTVELGVEHIRTGADHVMFILVLLLPSVLVFRRDDWQPAAGFRPSLVRVIKMASAFTVAHSITLSLAALGVLDVNSQVVETIIALSIILAALHNLRPVVANREWMIAFAFGLFHGLGFAGLLGELGLARDQKVLTLLGFNLGVEVGQVAIILAIFPTLFLLRRIPAYPTLMKVGSVVLALVAAGWAVERVLGLEARVDRLFDPVLYYPRVLLLLVAAVVVAAVVRTAERRRGRLVMAGD